MVSVPLISVEFMATYASRKFGPKFPEVLRNQGQTNRVPPYKRDLRDLRWSRIKLLQDSYIALQSRYFFSSRFESTEDRAL